jgi:hypothetical protein
MSNFRVWTWTAATAIALQLAILVWTNSFIRNSEMRAPYSIVAIVGILGFLYSLRGFSRRGWMQALLAGMASGYLASFLALQIAKLFDRGGIRTAFRGVSEFGLFNVITTDAAVAFIVGGWAVGAMVSVVLLVLARSSGSSPQVLDKPRS